MINFYSFDRKDPVFDLCGWQISAQIIGVENIYGLSGPNAQHSNAGEITCTRLTYAGAQQSCAGSCTLEVQPHGDGGLRLRAHAALEGQKIRCVKLILRNLEPFAYYDYNGVSHTPDPTGEILHYPWPMRFPLIVFSSPGGYWSVRCEEKALCPVRFAFVEESSLFGEPGKKAVELVFEQDARFFSDELTTPEWVIEPVAAPADAYLSHLGRLEAEGALSPFEQRTDCPAWLREIRLCATLHGMHWSGRVFLDFAQMKEILKFLSSRLNGNSILVYIAGWEGRYYWQYGDYRPAPELGGESGFQELCDFARDKGIHIMPMFGGNCVNRRLPNFSQYGENAVLKTPFRNPHLGNCPDWNQDRSHDSGWQVWLNPGHPAWQRELCGQILSLQKRYGFDSVFLDTINCYENDPDFSVFQGIESIRNTLRRERDLMVMCEDWYDRLLCVFPAFLDECAVEQLPTPEYLAKYVRFFSFLGHNEPSRNRPGVQHFGKLPFELKKTAGYIPTLSFIDGTLELSRKQIEGILQEIVE